MLHKSLSQAVKWSLIPRNVTEAVSAPRPAPKEMRPLSAEEVRKLLESARGNDLKALWVLAVHTRIRQSELLALKWTDVDLEAGKVGVRRTLTREGVHYRLGEPKTKRSRRTDQAHEGGHGSPTGPPRSPDGRDGPAGGPVGLVFTTDSGAPLNPSNIRNRNLRRLTRKASLPQIRFHDLSHTCATLLLSKNVHPKIVQEMLGHATVAITLDTYSHVLPGMGDQAATAMEDAFL